MKNILFSLSTRIKDGPYKYLYTTPEKEKFVYDFSESLECLPYTKEKTILCYYNFPACYLFTSLKMNFYSTWVMNWWMSKESFDKLLIYVKNGLNLHDFPDIVVGYKYNDKSYTGMIVGDSNTLNYDPITNMFGNDYFYSSTKTSDYEILIKK